jgi:hypothetical protein
MTGGRLTDEELSSLDRNGCVVRMDVFSTAEVAAIIAACEDLVARLVRDRQLKRYKAGSYVFAPDFERNTMMK